jgi:hypothetical protein
MKDAYWLLLKNNIHRHFEVFLSIYIDIIDLILLKKYIIYDNFLSDNSKLIPIFSNYLKYKEESATIILAYMVWMFITLCSENTDDEIQNIFQSPEIFWEFFEREKKLLIARKENEKDVSDALIVEQAIQIKRLMRQINIYKGKHPDATPGQPGRDKKVTSSALHDYVDELEKKRQGKSFLSLIDISERIGKKYDLERTTIYMHLFRGSKDYLNNKSVAELTHEDIEVIWLKGEN